MTATLANTHQDMLTIKDEQTGQLRPLNRQEWETIRQGGTFNLYFNAKPTVLKCSENFTNVEHHHS